MMKNKRSYHNYTLADIQYIQANYAEVSAQEIANHIGVTKRGIYAIARKLGLYKSKEYVARVSRERAMDPSHGGVATRYQPGHVPFTKGRRQEDYCTPEAIARSARTRFKVGNKPKNWRPIGSERVTVDGYCEIKVEEGLRGWRLKHRIEWEKHHGKVPKGYRLSFRDGDKQNCDIGNLYLVSVADVMRNNTMHNFPEDLREVIHIRSRIRRELNKQKKNNHGEM